MTSGVLLLFIDVTVTLPPVLPSIFLVQLYNVGNRLRVSKEIFLLFSSSTLPILCKGLRMTQFLPPNLLLLFQPRPPIPYLAPIEKPKLPPYSGIGQFVKQFEDPATVDYSQFKPVETKDQRRERKRKERQAAEEDKIEKLKAACTFIVHVMT